MIRTIEHIAVIWLLLFGGSQLMASDGDTAFLRNTRKIDVCDDAKKSVIITLDIGEISRSDSLYGYNFRVDFDSEKIDFHTFLDLNTLSEKFQYKGANFFNSEGYMEGYAVNLTGGPVSGDKPLFGLFGNFIGDCPETTSVTINYLDFTDEFNKSYTVYMDAEVIATVEDKADRFLSVEFDNDTIQSFNDDLETEALLLMQSNPGLRLEYAEIELSVRNTDLFEVNNVESASENVILSDIEYENGIVKFRAFTIEDILDETALIASIKQLEKSDEIAEIYCTINRVNECSCITRLHNDQAILKGIPKDTSTSVFDTSDDDLKCYYDISNDNFVIDSDSENILNYEIYDINGHLLVHKSNINAKKEIIEATFFSAGCYIIRSEFLSRKQYIKILVKY
jgi:hypothetical protein